MTKRAWKGSEGLGPKTQLKQSMVKVLQAQLEIVLSNPYDERIASYILCDLDADQLSAVIEFVESFE